MREAKDIMALLRKWPKWRFTEGFSCAVGDRYLDFHAGQVETNPALLLDLLSETEAPLEPIEAETAETPGNDDDEREAAVSRVCATCKGPLGGRQAKFCSTECRMKHLQQRAVESAQRRHEENALVA